MPFSLGQTSQTVEASVYTFSENALAEESDCPILRLGEGVQDVSPGIDMPEGQLGWCRFQVGKAIDLVRERPAPALRNLDVVEVRSSRTGAHKAGGMSIKLDVLQIVIVTCQMD